MFVLAFLIGSYAYSIFFLGVLRLLKPEWIILISFLHLLIILRLFIKPLFILLKPIPLHLNKLNKWAKLILFLIVIQSSVNLVGALGPELGFDALWYHLTLPKMWLSEGYLRYYPGPVFKYSVMPMLTEMLYIPSLVFSNEIAAKFIHYSLGVLTLIVTYKLSRKFLNETYSLLSCLLLSSNLVFSWQSTTAYIDLSRTFFEVLALYFFLENKLYRSAVTLGLAASTKLLALGTLPVFWILILISKYKKILTYSAIVFAVLLPWLIRAYIETGNPAYPFLSPLYTDNAVSLNPLDLWRVFTTATDPVSPVYLISAPLTVAFFLDRRRSRGERLLSVYCLFVLFIWWITPRTGGGRFLLPYLPALSVLTSLTIYSIQDKFIKKYLLLISVFLALVTIGYRSAANYRYLPVIFGLQTGTHFLASHLNFASGDYIDASGYLKSVVSGRDQLLVMGINNMFYLEVPFVHADFWSFPDRPVYILLYKNQAVPETYSSYVEVRTDPLTGTRILHQP